MRGLVGGVGLLSVLAACAAHPDLRRMEAPSAPDRSSRIVLDSRWQIVSLNGDPVRGTANFTDGKFQVHFGCNTMRGTYTVDGRRWIPTGAYSTERGCDAVSGQPDPMLIEDRGFAIVKRPAALDIDGSTLTMSTIDGVLVLKR